MSPNRPRAAGSLKVALALVALLVLAYSVLIATQPLLGVVVAVMIAGAYLVWRFVYAFERIADALEVIAADRAGDD